MTKSDGSSESNDTITTSNSHHFTIFDGDKKISEYAEIIAKHVSFNIVVLLTASHTLNTNIKILMSKLL